MADGAQMQAKGLSAPSVSRGQLIDFDPIFQRVANGESLRSVAIDTGMSEAGLRYLIARDEELTSRYAHARELQADHYAEKIMEICETATNETYQRDRLRMDALKWAASKMAPRRYGDSMQLKHADADGKKLDTTPLIGELMTILGQAQGSTDQAQAAAGDTALNVTPDVKGDK